jgi:hypothetical protein
MMTQSHFLVFYDMVVVGSEEKIRRKRDGADDDLTVIFSGMNFDEDDNAGDHDDNDVGLSEGY